MNHYSQHVRLLLTYFERQVVNKVTKLIQTYYKSIPVVRKPVRNLDCPEGAQRLVFYIIR